MQQKPIKAEPTQHTTVIPHALFSGLIRLNDLNVSWIKAWTAQGAFSSLRLSLLPFGVFGYAPFWTPWLGCVLLPCKKINF